MTPPWSFYGRQQELSALTHRLLEPGFGFVRITGRRRIGKTTLVMASVRRADRRRVAYIPPRWVHSAECQRPA